MSWPRITSQATPALLVSFPNWKQPTLCGVRFTIGGGAGAATVISTESDQGDAPTTPHWSIAKDGANAGIYMLTFPAVRRWAPSTLHCTWKTVATNGTFATTDLRHPVIDRSATNTVPRGIPATPATGRIRIGFFTNAGAVPAELADGLEGNLSIWVDPGS